MFCFMTSITYQEREKESHPWKIKILIGFGRSLTVICQEELIFVQFHLWFLHVLTGLCSNQIFCHLLFCHITLSLSIKSGASAVTATAVHCDWVDTIKRETHTHQIKVLLNSKQESPLFLVNFIQYCSICVALSGVFSSLWFFAEPAK